MKKKSKFTKEELKLMEEMDALSAKAQADPQIRNMSVPESLWYELQRDIREYNEEKRVKEQEQRNQELIKLGLVYERKRKYRKYYVLAATLVLVMALGITSMGGPEKVFEKIGWVMAGRNQTNIDSNSDNVIIAETSDEEEFYEKIEEEYGFYPIRIAYLPEGVKFQEAMMGDAIQEIVMVYGDGNEANITYCIKPNYREGSLGIDIEDELSEQYNIDVNNIEITVREFLVKDNASQRWTAEFVYKNVGYHLFVTDCNLTEFKKIIESLVFV